MFHLSLTGYGRDFDFPREKFIAIFPSSIITAAVTNSDEKIVEINQPCVTPAITQYLLDFLIQNTLDPASSIPPPLPPINPIYLSNQDDILTIPFPDDLAKAGQYLGIPLLEIVAYPGLRHLHARINGKTIPITHLSDIDQRKLYYKMCAYVAVYLNHVHEFQLLRQYITATPYWNLLYTMQSGQNINSLHCYNLIWIAGNGNANEMMEFLSTTEQFTEVEWMDALHIAVYTRNVKMIDIIQPFVLPNKYEFIIDTAIWGGDLNVMGHLLMDARTEVITPLSTLRALIKAKKYVPVGFWGLENADIETLREKFMSNIDVINALPCGDKINGYFRKGLGMI